MRRGPPNYRQGERRRLELGGPTTLELMITKHTAAEASRLLPLTRSVLERYPFDVREVTHLATHSNVLYRVVTREGHQRVLRVGSPQGNSRANIEYEVAWLAALNRETDLDLVAPIPNGYGSYIVEATEPDTGVRRSCVLFSWVPGEPLTHGSGAFGYRLLGQMSAQLHRHGATWRPENPDGMRKWNQVFYYDRELDPVVINEGRNDHLFDTGRRRAISKAGRRATELLHQTWKEGEPQVVHGDLHEWNVHMAGSRLYAFDFEDVMLATRGQDVSVALYSSRMNQRADGIRQAFRRGYESIEPWPIEDEEHLDGFHAARQIMLMNYAARTLPLADVEEYLDQVMPWLEDYVRRYW
jgi:Ser/Thr protein kinase RdoA (MazF antagonist)